MSQQADFDASEDMGPDSMDKLDDYFADGPVLSRLQIALQRQIGGWPLYTIILALGQVSCRWQTGCDSLKLF